MMSKLSDLQIKAIEIVGSDGSVICDGVEYSGTRVHNGVLWWYCYRGCIIDGVFYSFGYGSPDKSGKMTAPSTDKVFVDFMNSFTLI